MILSQNREQADTFATYYYDPAMSKYDFEYQLVSFEESLKRVAEGMKI